jgi:plastocyanin
MRARITACVTAIGLAMAVTACGGNKNEPTPTPNPGPVGEEPVRITIPSSDGYGSSSFSPSSVTIAVGKTIEWENRDTIAHTTTSDTGVWSSTISPNGDYQRTFTAAGTFNYRCTLHAGMNGTITVQ